MPLFGGGPSKDLYVFLSYRRRDLEAVEPVAAALDEALGDDHVFFDIADIHAGARWEALLYTQVLASDVLIVAIAEHWLSEFSVRAGGPDFVVREIALALQERIPILPVFFPGVPVPTRDQLPPEISDLMNFQGIELRSLDDIASAVAAIYEIGIDPGREGRSRKINDAKSMAQWFATATDDERVVHRASGTKVDDPTLIVSDRRLFIAVPNQPSAFTEISSDLLFAVRHEPSKLWLIGLDFEYSFQRLKLRSPEAIASELVKKQPGLDLRSGKPDDALWFSRRICRAREHLQMRDEIFATAGENENDAVLFITPDESVLLRRRKEQEGSVSVPHGTVGAICAHNGMLWLLGPQGEYKIDRLPEDDLEQVVTHLRERAPKALVFGKPPDRDVRESLIVLDPNGLAAQNGIDLSWTTRLRPTDEEAIVLAVAKLHLMEADLADDPDWDDRVEKRKTIDAYVNALVGAFAGEVTEDKKSLSSLEALRNSIKDEWADRFRATVGELSADDARRVLLDEELRSVLFASVTRRDRAIVQLVELTSFYPWARGTKFERDMRERTCRDIADAMAAAVDHSDFDLIDKELKRRAKVLGGKSVNWRRLAPLIVGGTAIGIATGGLATPFIGGAIGSAMGLTGAAATSAGLALLGGGSLAAGGAGMAGGMALIGVLGGVVGVGAGIVTDRAVDMSREGLLTESVKLDLLSDLVLLSERGEARQVALIVELLNAQMSAIKERLESLKTARKEATSKGQDQGAHKTEDLEDLEGRLMILQGLTKALTSQLVMFIDRAEDWIEPSPALIEEIQRSRDPALLVSLRPTEGSQLSVAPVDQVITAQIIRKSGEAVASVVVDVLSGGIPYVTDDYLLAQGMRTKVADEAGAIKVDVVSHRFLWSSVADSIDALRGAESGELADALSANAALLPAGSTAEWLDRHGIDFKKFAKKALALIEAEMGRGSPDREMEVGEGLTLSLTNSDTVATRLNPS